MIELLQNPVTVIFGILAVFFVLMSFGRHVVRKRNHLAVRPSNKPYELSDPYADQDDLVPPDSVVVAQQANSSASAKTEAKSYFTQYVGHSKVTGSSSPESTSGYIWE